jgi:hypothetical protein
MSLSGGTHYACAPGTGIIEDVIFTKGGHRLVKIPKKIGVVPIVVPDPFVGYTRVEH